MEAKIKALVQRLMNELVDANYERVFSNALNSRLSVLEIEAAIREYGKKLVNPPDGTYSLVDIIGIKGSEIPAWSVVMPFYSEEEGRSDLSLVLTITEVEGDLQYEVDDIHVL